MADVIIFGATSAGAHLKTCIPAGDRVVCFVDAHRDLAGTTFEGLPVVPPAALCALDYDRVLIAASDAAGTLTFLLKLGVPLDRIGLTPPLQPTDDTGRPTAVVYGSRLEALRTLPHAEREYRVVCFCDPDPAAQGRRLAGRLVIAPADLCVLRFDRVFIGVADTYKAVHDLLWSWKVPIDKMDVAPESILFPPDARRPDGRARTVIFGAGSSGERAFRQLRHRDEIVAFVDNSPAKRGTRFCGLPVHAPAALEALDYDRIVIGSMFAAEIMEQLATLGVDASRFVLLDSAAPADAAAAGPVGARPLWRRLFTGRSRFVDGARG